MPASAEQPKKLSKWLIGLIVIAGVGAIALIVLPFAFILSLSSLSLDKRSQVEQELRKIPAAPGCQETDRSYTKAGIDTLSMMSVTYRCQASGGLVYDSLMNRFKQLGYRTVTNDAVGENKTSYRYNLRFSSAEYRAEVRLRYGQDQPDHAATPQELRLLPISGYTLDLAKESPH